MNAIVKCAHGTKSYGNIIAVNDVSPSIEEGEVFGSLRPNGALKTTLIEMIGSLRSPNKDVRTVYIVVRLHHECVMKTFDPSTIFR